MNQQSDVILMVQDIFCKQLNRENISAEEVLELSSIETLNILAQIERIFMIEVDDNLVFGGIFANINKLSKYILEQLRAEAGEEYVEQYQ